jgi:hypothetical protein
MTPPQIDAIEQLLFLLFSLLFVPIAWLYAEKRGRRPWLWASLALFISWVAVLLLRLLPDKTVPPTLPQTAAGMTEGENAGESECLEQIRAQRHLRDLLRNDPH